MVRKLVLSLIAVLGGGMLLAMAQKQQVSGTVTNADGNPIVGATVVVDGTTTGTTTNAAGQFSLQARSDGYLNVSFIGYESQKVPIAGKTTVNIQLKEDITAIDDVLVVAFGTTKKEAFTGSASVIKSEDLQKRQTTNVMNALVGSVAGLQMRGGSGTPGSDSGSINIRGISSMYADTDPLIIVDGAPYSASLSNIPQSDIESVTVLKDAASAALYGARGASGVIIVTTKRSQARDAVINVDMKWGVNSRAVQDYDVITDPGEYYEAVYAQYYNRYFYGQGMNATTANAQANTDMLKALAYDVYTRPDGENLIGLDGKLNPNATLGRKVSFNGTDYWMQPDDWTDAAYKNSLRQEYNVSVNGGTDKATYYTSVGYLNEDGIVDNSGYERISARIKADYQAKKWLKFGANATYSRYRYNQIDDSGAGNSSGNVFAYTTAVGPIYPLYIRDGEGRIRYNEDGIKLYDYGNGDNAGMERSLFTNSNALSESRLNKQESEGNAFNGTAYFDVTFLKDFKFTFNAGVSLDETRSTSVLNPWFGQFASEKGSVSKGHQRNFDLNLQQILNYTKQIGPHNINVMLGHESYQNRIYLLSASKSNMLTQDNDELAGAIIDKQAANSYRTEYNNEGYFARVMYDYENKYFFSASYRRDASSRFHPDHRWGNFWSLGGAWIISKENFMESTYEWLDNLKLKASIGSQGNDNIGDFRYTDTYSINNANGEVSTVFKDKGSENITWETNSNFNAGVEFSFLRGTVSGGVEYFLRKTTDMLLAFPVPPSKGYSSYYANVGDMRNSGIEIELNFTPIRRENLVWDINLNMTHLRNKITMLPPERRTKQVDGYSGYVSGSTFFGEGLPMYTFYMRKYAGVSDEGLSMWYMDETDDKGNPTGKRVTTTEYAKASDYLCGDPIPDLYGGFGTSVNFRGFDLSVAFTYQIGGLAYDSGYAAAMYSPANKTTGMNWHKDILKAWSADNASSDIPRLQYEDKDQNNMSDRFLMDASYLNLQNINFGYTLPAKFTKKVGIEKVRVYLACENVWYWSKRQGFDPRYSYSGSTSQATYSPVRTISGGINIQF